MAELQIRFMVRQSTDGKKIALSIHHPPQEGQDANKPGTPIFSTVMYTREGHEIAFALLNFDQETREAVRILMAIEHPDDAEFDRAVEQMEKDTRGE